MRAANRYIIFVISIVAFLAEGCKQEGCTDRSALNYNSLAKEDDGSCLYCEQQKIQKGSASVDVIDYNYSSPYYYTTVARVLVTQTANTYNFSSCGEEACMVYYEVQNILNRKISFYYSLSGFGEVFFNTPLEYANLEAYQTSVRDSTVASGSFGNSCGTLFPGQVSVNVSGNISYY
jgi:hypothetical protein